MHKVTLTALTKYPDIWAAFHANVAKFVPDDIRKIVVVDGDLITPEMCPGWDVLKGPERFSMAGNHNVAWHAVEPDSDIYNSNDDIYFLESDPIGKYQELCYSEPKIGAVSAYSKIGLFGGPFQQRPRQDVPLTFVTTCTNSCAYFRRDMIDEVGYYDESFDEKYGAEDADHSYRINLADWKVAIARDIPVKHGFGEDKYSSTAKRAIPEQLQSRSGVERFKRKHGHWNVTGQWDWSKCGT